MIKESKVNTKQYNFDQIKCINNSFSTLQRGIWKITHNDLLFLFKKHIIIKNIFRIYKLILLRRIKKIFNIWRNISKNKINDNNEIKIDEEGKTKMSEEINRMNNILNEEIKKNDILNNKVKELEKFLNEEKEKNIKDKDLIRELNEKIKELEKISNKDYIINLMEKIIRKDELIRDLESKFPFKLSKDEKLMSIIFISANQEIKQSIICKNTDIFNKLVNILYDKYPSFRKNDNFFICNGKKVDEYQSLEKNGIGDSAVIILNKIYL